MNQGICGFPSRLSHKVFPRGFPTGLSHVPPWCESILGLKVEAVQGKQVSLQWPEKSGGLWEWGLILEFLSSFLWRAPPLEMRRERRKFFHDHAGKGSLLSSYEAETGLLWMWADSRTSSRVKTGMSGNFFSCSKGVKDHLEVPDVRCD